MDKRKKISTKSGGNGDSSRGFPIVGIGASAGGLEAINELLLSLPSTTGMAFVIVQHLDPTHGSMTAEIFSKKTSMPVAEVEDGVLVEPNHIYVMPPSYSLEIQDRALKLREREETQGQHLPINLFFRSLAADQKNRSVGVVLSGTASDGTQGLQAIKAEGGVTIAQEPQSAKFDGMPRSAISSGVVDIVLAPKEIAVELERIALHPLLSQTPSVTGSHKMPEPSDDDFGKILNFLRSRCQVDFTLYRQSTIKRRIERRMVLCRKTSLKDYFDYVSGNPEETKRLFADLLINVTEFFRDSKIALALKTQIFPKIINKKNASKAPIRIWVVGCASGEEAYSVAISIREYLGDAGNQVQVQIFGTDVSEAAIQKARAGEYPESIRESVSKDRLKRFFTRTAGGYKVNKFIRGMCIFSRHDVTRDPPFAKLDLICCRNLLIYFEPSLQKRVIPIFHYALKAGGVLWLGKSETVGSLSSLFSLLDKEKKFYARNSGVKIPSVKFPPNIYIPELQRSAGDSSSSLADTDKVRILADRSALAEYVPPSVVVDSDMEIILNRGDTSPFLQLPFGQTSLNLFKMARTELASDLRMTIQSAKNKNVPVVKSGLKSERADSFSIKVVPLQISSTSKELYYSIFFESIPGVRDQEAPGISTGPLDKDGKKYSEEFKKLMLANETLRRELKETKAYQQGLIVDFEAAKEELTSANEEMQSANEEFQSTNEELETAKEELQSANEELSTVNDEMRDRNADLSHLNNDLINFLGAVDTPVVMLDIDGCIRRFTPSAGKVLNLIPGDVGRPFSNIKQNFNVPDLPGLISEVVDNITSEEREVQDSTGRWFRLQIRPYKTADNRIDGAVISLIDIDILKRGLSESKSALDYASSIANTVQLPLVVLDRRLTFISANDAFFENFSGVTPRVGRDFLSIFGESKSLKLKNELTRVLESQSQMKNIEIGVDGRCLVFNARSIRWIEEQAEALLLSIEDITDRRRLELELKESEAKHKGLVIKEQEARAEAERANHAKDEFLTTLSHELRTPLTSILSWSQLIQNAKIEPEKIKQGITTIERNAKLQGQLIDDLLDVSRIRSGKLAMNFTDVNPREVIESAIESVRLMADSKGLNIDVQMALNSEVVWGDPMRLQQVVWNLLTNAIKFSSPNERIQVRTDVIEELGRRMLSIKVIDQGRGIKREFLGRLFKRFTQEDSSSIRPHGGLGLGLAIVYDLLRLQGGSVHAESEGLGKGATFTVLMPIKSDSEMVYAQKMERQDTNSMVGPDLSGLCVMVVEDEPDTREAIKVALESFGAEVVSCDLAASALAAFDNVKPDILVSDIAMPVEDGNSLIRKIRNFGSKGRGDIPALALTAYASEEDVQLTLAAGFNSHLAKPFDTFDLGQAVMKLARKTKR